MDPIVALNRIAYLLEDRGEPTYKVRAFRNAAATVAAIDEEDLRQRAGQDRLRDLPGIGDKTGRVISEALAGESPSYLQRLEMEERDSLPEAASRLRAALRGDCHMHSDWSDGGSPVSEMAEAARSLGHEYMVLTDHSPRLTIANGLSADRLRSQLDLVEQLNEALAPFKILTGIEVDILDDGAIDQDETLLAKLDVVVASVHSKLRMDESAMTRRMLAAVSNPHVDILGHCTGRIVAGKGRPESSFDAEQVFSKCAQLNKAVEINSRPDRLDPPKRLLRKLVDLGCVVSIDSDAHAPGQLEWQRHGCRRAVECGLEPEAVVNTRDADGLLAWAASHSA